MSAAPRGALETRLEELRAGTAWSAYERVRDWVLDTAGDSAGASAYWAEELETLDFMLDASPLIIERLRHHTYPITGIRPYEYRSGKDRAAQYAAKLEALASLGGRDLRVPESPALGGFGHEIGGALWNIDTLKYHEVLVALEQAAVLWSFRRDDARRVVWEIGAGWGGFAYQFKTLFPDTTYLIVDLPHVLLYSGTYLQTVFPEARIHLYGEGDVDWDRADFVLAPHTALDELAPPRLDLTLNMVSFQEMTQAQVEGYVRRAHELGSPFVYSLNRERSRYNDELISVSDVISRRYWLYEIPVLPVSYLKMLDTSAPSKARRPKTAAPEGDYRHLLGRSRAAP
ncbi:MAG: hypothetical protein QOD69_2573 [Solirubrobacteraceae bacterium]|nr:hypothetical protein [Solirubrobacteraceae bacterium]